MNVSKNKATRKKYDKEHTGKTKYRHKGFTREQYTAPWQDNPTLGMLHFLQVYGRAAQPQSLSFMQFEQLICWGERTLKNIMHHYLLKSCLRDRISKFGLPKNRSWLLEDYEYTTLPLLTFSNLVEETHYACRYRKNRPEKILHDILDELYELEWAYTGDNRPENKIGNLIPDFINIKRKLIIEHFGDYWHHEDEILGKRAHYRKHGFKTLIIWEHELKNRNKVINKIKKFVEGNNAV